MGCGDKPDKDKKLEKGGDSDCSEGPIEKRSCTDPQCCLLFCGHWVVFVAVAAMGFGGGNPEKLVYPRDFSGNYCGTDDNWKTGAMLKDSNKLLLTMNISSVMDSVAKELICGTTGKLFLTESANGEPLMTTAEYEDCCGAPLNIPLTPEEAEAQAAAMAAQYSDPNNAAALMSSSGGSILSQITKYFYPTCTPDCAVAAASPIPESREYKFTPSPGAPWAKAWNMMMKNVQGTSLQTTIDQFTFTALSYKNCPYDPMYCVPFPGIEFEDIAGYCTPKLNDAAKAAADAAMNSMLDGLASSGATEAVESNFGTMIGDLQTSLDVFIIVCIISLIVGFTFLVILRYTVGCVVWTSIFLVFVLFVAGGALAVVRSGQCKDQSMQDAGSSQASAVQDQAAANGTAVEIPECLGGYLYPDPDQRDMIKYTGFVLLGIAGVWALLICCMFKRIQIAVAINKVAADFVGDTKTIIAVPVVQILIAIVWWIIWIFCAVFVVSQVPDGYIERGPFTYLEAEGNKDTPGQCTNKWPAGFSYQNQSAVECTPELQKCYMCAPPRYTVGDVRFAYIFFSLLWNNAFNIALGQCIIAGSVAGWYFTKNAEKGSKAVIMPSVKRTFVYHTGSLAFGAFILAVVQFIKWVMYYLKKQQEANKNECLAKVFACLQYLFWCFEKCVEFLNKNAYIQIALLGKWFCTSAWNAFVLIIRNAGRIGTLGTIGGVVHLIGTVFIMSVTGFIGYMLLGALHPDDVSSPVMPTLLYITVGYVAAKLIMNVFGLAVDTVLQCFVANEELGGSSDFTPKQLAGFMSEHKEPDQKKGCCGDCCTIL
jgi:solute carrier family 44 protein 1 (choline transporter-like protein)/choline transporter-like protein 2/4/5